MKTYLPINQSGLLRQLLCLPAIVFATLFCWSGGAKADNVAYWNFNTLSIPTAGLPGTGSIPTSISASQGTGTLSLAGFMGNVDDFAGSTINAISPDPSGASLSLLGGGSTSPFPGNGTYIEIQISLTGFINPIITFATQRTTTGFTTGAVSYSIGGGSFTNVSGADVTPPSSYALRTIDLSGVDALDGQADVKIRYTLTGASASSGNNRIDNLLVAATASGPVPTITGNATATPFTATYGTVSSSQTFPVSGVNLTADITATAPTGFEVSNDGITYGATATLTQSGGNAAGDIYVRLKADAAVTGTPYNSVNVALTSTGATTKNITTAASGNVVTAKGLTITGLTGSDKVYDGNNTASFTGTPEYAGLVNSETFSVSGSGSATFADAAAGMAKPITVTGFTPPTTNYTLTQPSLSADIDPAPLTITANNVTKTLGDTLTGGPGSTAFTSTGLIAPDAIDSVTIAYGPAGASGASVGFYPDEITPSAPIGTNFAASNYDITYDLGDITVSNTPVITITGTLAEVDTVYGTASPTPTSFNTSGSALSANLMINAPPGFEVSTSIGSGYASSIQLAPSSGTVPTTIVYVRLAATTIVGTFSGDVTVSSTGATSQTIATAPSDVTAKELTITGVTADDKVYDGATTATLTGTPSLVGVESQDAGNVTLAGMASADFADANVADDIAVTVLGYTLSGSAAGNYTVAQPTGLMADITEATLTVTGAAVTTKPYDATTDAEITGTLNGVIGMDDVSLNGTGTFADPNVGTGIAVTSTSTLLGNAAGNYILTQPTGLTGDIIKASQIITFAALPVKTTADAPFALTAVASSGLTVSYASSNLSVATVAVDTLTIAGEGVTQITATQAGDSNYEAAPPVVRAQAVIPPGGATAIYLTENGSYMQNFNGMGTGASPPYPTGWTGYNSSTGTAVLSTITTGTGSSGTGAIYNYGTAANTDRALGAVASGSFTGNFGASFVNYTGSTVEGANVQLTFAAEQWRSRNASGPIDPSRYTFKWKIGGSITDSSGWSLATALDLVEVQPTITTNGALDGNLPANRVVVPLTNIPGLTGWETGQTLHIVWSDANDLGNDAAMAVDDFQLALSGVIPPPPKTYWDSNGDTAGAGGPSPTGIWGTDTFWSTSLAGDVLTSSWPISGDAVFAAGTDATGAYTVTLNGQQDVGALFVEEGNVTLTGGIFQFADITPVVNVASGSGVSIESPVQGSSGLLKQGAGRLSLIGSNTFAGTIVIGGGSLAIAGDDSLGISDNDVILGGGVLEIINTMTLSASRDISGSGGISPLGGASLTLPNNLSISSLIFGGTGGLILNGTANTIGTLTFAEAGSIQGGEIATTSISANQTSGLAQVNSKVNFGTASRTVNVANPGATLELNDSVTLNGTGNAQLAKSGPGTLALGGLNLQLNKLAIGGQGAVPTNGGRVIFYGPLALGNTQIFFNYGILEAGNELIGAGAVNLGLSIGGRSGTPSEFDGSAVEFTGASALTSFSGTSGDIFVTVNNHTILSGTLTASTSLGGTISGLTLAGDGKLTLSGGVTGYGRPIRLTGTVTLELNTPELGSVSLFGTVAEVHELAANTILSVGTVGTTSLVTIYDGIEGAAGSALHFDINGLSRGNPTDGYDALIFAKNNNGTEDLAGPITFAGKIDVDFGTGFVPADGQSFDLLDWDPLVTPDFTGVDFSELPTLPAGLGWDTDDFATDGIIRIESTIPTLKFAVNTDLVSESAGTVQVAVTILPAPNLNVGQTVTVPFTVATGSSATSGLDYTISATSLRFGPGETTKFITINVKPDTLDNGMFGESTDETVIINLGNPTPTGLGGVVAGTAAERMFTLTIRNDYRTANFLLGVPSLASQSKIVNTGAAVEFKTTPVGSAVLKLQWLKNGANLGAAVFPPYNPVPQEQTYSIAAATLANGGRYSAKASNPLKPAGEITPTSAELVVVEQLATFAAPRLTLGKTGTNFVITTNATGNGLQYRWYRDGVAILDSETALYSGMGSKSLTIKALDLAKEGIYQCRVTSSIAALAGEFAEGTAFKVRTAITPEVDTASFPMGRLPDAIVGAVYSPPVGFTIPILNDTEGRKTPTTWTQKGLPAGLTINSLGVISGNPTVSISTDTTYNVTLTAANPGGTLTVPTTIVVRPLRANAVGSFVAVAGRSGTFAGKTGSLNLGARLDFTTTLSGSVTGKLFVGTTAYKLPKLRLNSANPLLPTLTAVIKRKAPLTELTVNVTIDATTALVTGTLTDATTTADFDGWRNVWSTKVVKLTKSATTAGSVAVATNSTVLLKPGMYVVGPGIPIGAKVDTITNATSFNLTLAATVTSAAPTVTLNADFGARNFTGLYNFALEVPTTPPSGVPLGNGFASFTIATTGKLTVAGKTSDGQAISTAAFVGPNGEVIVYRQLYATVEKGSLVGSLDIDNGTASDFSDNTLDGTVSWMRPADPAAAARTYKAGFTAFDLTAIGGRYVAPLSPNLILGLTSPGGNATLEFNEGGLSVRNNPAPMLPAPNAGLSVDALNKLTMIPGTTTTIVNSANVAKLGKFNGQFVLTDDNPRTTPPVTPLVVTRTVKYEGIIIRQGSDWVGYGYFLLPALPTNSPLTTTTTSPILSGQVVFEKQ